MRDEGNRFVAWRLGETSETFGVDPEDERMEHALLAYAQRARRPGRCGMVRGRVRAPRGG